MFRLLFDAPWSLRPQASQAAAFAIAAALWFTRGDLFGLVLMIGIAAQTTMLIVGSRWPE